MALRGYLAVILIALSPVGALYAQLAYTIPISLDPSTQADADLLGSALKGAPTGAATQSTRKLAAAVNGEVDLLLSSRLDANDYLKLDNGNVVQLVEGDELRIVALLSGVTVTVIRQKTFQGSPAGAIKFQYADGTCKVLLLKPPPPTTQTC